jgi:isopentenyl diphosphate isomerase/L-lactate dehydrogenase-like FMN-dependent dehydrogenase
VALALQILRNELAVSMALTGCRDVRAVERSLLL